MTWVYYSCEANNLESSLIVHALELAITRALFVVLKLKQPIHHKTFVLVVLDIYRKLNGYMAEILLEYIRIDLGPTLPVWSITHT